MPGIAALFSSENVRPAVDMRLQGMTDALRHHDWYQQDQYVNEQEGVGLARVSLGFVEREVDIASSEDGRFLAVMDGEIYNSHDLRLWLKRPGEALSSHMSQAALLASGYATSGDEFLSQVDGIFAAVLWDRARREAMLLNDRFGMKPLYYVHGQHELLVASSIQSLIAGGEVDASPDVVGLSQFLTFGHYFGQHTSLNGVRLLPPGACFRFQLASGDLEPRTYWQTTDIGLQPHANLSEAVDRVDAAFQVAVDRRLDGSLSMGLSLSGGLDARTILGVIDHQRFSLQTVCLGMEGSLDHRCAQQMADIVGCGHHPYTLSTDFLNEFRSHLETMVALTDGQYLSQGIVIPTLELYRKLGIQILLRGHAGELMHMRKAYSFSLDREALAIADSRSLQSWLACHLQAYMLDGVEGNVLARVDRQEMQQIADETLASALRPLDGIDPLQQVWHLFVTQRLRRETTLSLMKLGSVVETRLPYMDKDLVELLLSIPPRWKLDDALQTQILRRRRPEFLRVVNANTSVKPGVGRMVENLGTLRSRLFAKLGLKGYQPYERLGLWLRRELAGTVRDILLSDECLERGVFDSGTARTVVNGHLNGHRNHTYLLLAMMTFELGQRHLNRKRGIAVANN